jgi:alpha-galactosidase
MILVGAVALVWIAENFAAPPLYRPAQEYRSTSAASYSVSIQKNGRIDVTLATGDPVFMNAYPMIWFEGEEAPVPISIDGRHTTRQEVNDQLGKGQGVVMDYKGCEWSHRTYPTEPYFTVQVAYTNTSKKTVRVKALYPWATGNTKGTGKNAQSGFTLGINTTDSRTLEGGKQFPGDATMPDIVRGPMTAMWNVATVNSVTGRSLIAGFLTHNSAYTQIELANPVDGEGEVNRFEKFAAACIFDPPVELEPGERLGSEALYLAISETSPLEGLERYGKAMALANDVSPAKPFIPHGWDSWSTSFRTDIAEASMLENLAFVSEHLKRYGWAHFAIDDGWEVANGDWEADPEKFPSGMKAMANRIHERGMTAGIWIAPFKVALDSQLAREHPEWLAEPSALGRQVVGKDDRILDVTAPGAYEFVRDTAKKIGHDWGFDALIEVDYAYYLTLAESYADPGVTRVEVMRLGMEALREGLGDRKFIMTTAPLPINGVFAQGMRLGTDCAPVWRQVPGEWPYGCVETLTNAARRYYYAPWMWSPDQDCAFFGHEPSRARWDVADQPLLTRQQSIAWLTGAALTGGAIKIGDKFTELNGDDVDVLRRLLPTLHRPARPVDLFTEDHPRIWSLPIRSAIGDWSIAGIFNWDETNAATVEVDFSDLGLARDKFYTVFDFWQETYFGTASNRLSVSVPPGSVRLLCLRPFEKRPMFLSTDRHYSQGATDFTALEWDETAKELRGTFDGVGDTPYALRLLVPAPYEVKEVTVSCGEPATRMEDRVLVMEFHCTGDGPVTWAVRF